MNKDKYFAKAKSELLAAHSTLCMLADKIEEQHVEATTERDDRSWEPISLDAYEIRNMLFSLYGMTLRLGERVNDQINKEISE
jgi:hypothetical protein